MTTTTKTTATKRVTRYGQNSQGGHNLGVRVLGISVLLNATEENQSRTDEVAALIAALAPEDAPVSASIDQISDVAVEVAPATTAPATPAAKAIHVGSRIRVLKGCNAIGITKGSRARVQSVTELGPDYSYAVRVELAFLNSFASGKTFRLYARHANRLADGIVNLNDGDPTHKIAIAEAR